MTTRWWYGCAAMGGGVNNGPLRVRGLSLRNVGTTPLPFSKVGFFPTTDDAHYNRNEWLGDAKVAMRLYTHGVVPIRGRALAREAMASYDECSAIDNLTLLPNTSLVIDFATEVAIGSVRFGRLGKVQDPTAGRVQFHISVGDPTTADATFTPVFLLFASGDTEHQPFLRADGRHAAPNGIWTVSTKSFAEVSAEMAAREAAANAAREAAEKIAQEAAEKAAQETAEKVAREAAEKVAQEAAAKAAQEAAEKVAREAAEKVAREAAAKAAQEAADKIAREAAAKAAQAAMKAPFSVKEASYGLNFNERHRGNRTSVFQGLANGKESFDYVFDHSNTGGDPEPGQGKTLEIKYTCGSGGEQTLTVPMEASGRRVQIDCRAKS